MESSVSIFVHSSCPFKPFQSFQSVSNSETRHFVPHTNRSSNTQKRRCIADVAPFQRKCFTRERRRRQRGQRTKTTWKRRRDHVALILREWSPPRRVSFLFYFIFNPRGAAFYRAGKITSRPDENHRNNGLSLFPAPDIFKASSKRVTSVRHTHCGYRVGFLRFTLSVRKATGRGRRAR